MLTILCCALAAILVAAPAAFIAYRKGSLYGARYALRYGTSLVRAEPPA
jgi:hypothetical protein